MRSQTARPFIEVQAAPTAPQMMTAETNDSLQQIQSEVIACRLCPRLVEWRERVAREKRRSYRDWDYWGKPLPAFGDPGARLVIVGLAPAAHGGNRTGRMFTGDASGDFLFAALHRAGFANQPSSTHRGDGLELRGALLTAACRCAPPANRPLPQELDNCRPYLTRELALLRPRVVVCLGRVAFDAVRRVYGLPALGFAHGAIHRLGPALPMLVCSFHPSQQNTNTGRLTVAQFDAVWALAQGLLSGG